MTQTATTGRWCSQHKQPRSACRPGDRHTQSMRASDELLAAVAAKAAELGLSRNDGIEMALEEFVGWHEPGSPWKGPRQWTGPARAASLAARVQNAGARTAADRILEERSARIRRLREQEKSATTAPEPSGPAPGSAVFMEPGGKPVVTAAVPEVPDRRSGKGRARA